jgi:hypothetical protein
VIEDYEVVPADRLASMIAWLAMDRTLEQVKAHGIVVGDLEGSRVASPRGGREEDQGERP